MANPTLRIYWSGVSILEAGLDCMEQLVNANAEWKFFFNAIGTALPGRPIQVKRSEVKKNSVKLKIVSMTGDCRVTQRSEWRCHCLCSHD